MTICGSLGSYKLFFFFFSIWQVCFPQLVVVGGGQSRPRHTGQGPLPPGLSGQGRAVDEADRLLRQAQAHQQPAGWQRTCEYYRLSFWPHKNAQRSVNRPRRFITLPCKTAYIGISSKDHYENNFAKIRDAAIWLTVQIRAALFISTVEDYYISSNVY